MPTPMTKNASSNALIAGARALLPTLERGHKLDAEALRATMGFVDWRRRLGRRVGVEGRL